MLNREQLGELLQKALGALADIGASQDMTLEMARRKAGRVYREIADIMEVDEGVCTEGEVPNGSR